LKAPNKGQILIVLDKCTSNSDYFDKFSAYKEEDGINSDKNDKDATIENNVRTEEANINHVSFHNIDETTITQSIQMSRMPMQRMASYIAASIKRLFMCAGLGNDIISSHEVHLKNSKLAIASADHENGQLLLTRNKKRINHSI
jgi:hypothetical protein